MSFAAINPFNIICVKPNQTSYLNIDYYDVIPDTTKVISPEQITSVVGAQTSNQQISFTGQVLEAGKAANINVNDTILVGVGHLSPYGLLEKVTSVTKTPEITTITTKPTTLIQAFPRLYLDFYGNPIGSQTVLNANQHGAFEVNLAGLDQL